VEVLAVRSDAGVVSGSVDDLYRREASDLLAMLTAFLGDRAAAEDVVQEAFVRVQRSWHRIGHGKEVPYLRTTAFNVARSQLRHRAVVAGFRPDRRRHAAAADDGVVLAEDQRAVVAALRALPVRQRECVVLRFYADLSESAFASTLGISPNSVKTHLRRGMAALATGLEARR
jgi:RNA polymerase sigma-70 factor (sigma-E family)